MSLFVERIHNEAGCLAIWREWEELDAVIEPRTPFTSPIWNTLWWKHFARNNMIVKDEFFLHIVRDGSGLLRAVVPWMITTRPSIGPVRSRILQYFGADQSLTEIRGPVCRRDDEVAVTSALRDYMRANNKLWDVVEWNGISVIESRDILEFETPLSFTEITPMYILPLPKTWQALNKSLSSYTRRNFRKAYEKLNDFSGKMELIVAKEKNDLANGMQKFFRLHALRANASNMSAHPDKFYNEINRKFVSEVFAEYSKGGIGRLFELRIEGKTVASRLCYVFDSAIYVYYTGYDPGWRDYNVGTILMVELVKWAIENEFSLLNLSTGKDHSKLRWKPDELLFHRGVQFEPTLRGKIMTYGYSGLVRLRHIRRKYAKFTGASGLLRFGADPQTCVRN